MRAPIAGVYQQAYLAKADVFQALVETLKRRKDDLPALVIELREAAALNKQYESETVYMSQAYMVYWGTKCAYEEVADLVESWLQSTSGREQLK